MAMKSLGKKISGLDMRRWRQKAPDLIIPGLIAKYVQNPVCQKFLLDSSDKIIAEASEDLFWGTGFGLNSPFLWCPTKWLGKNVMGHILESVRTHVRDQVNKKE